MKKVKNPQTLGDNLNNKMVDTYLSEQKTQSEVTVNESTHTPGPWYLSPQNHYVRANGVHGWNIAQVEDQPPFTEANARLIAAAPDMLEVLQSTYDLLNVGQPLGNDDLDKIYSALKKATHA